MANFFNWNCASTVTSIGNATLLGGTSLSTVAPPYAPGSMRLDVIGNDGGNQQMGAELSWIEYGTPFIGGPALFYRWWMRIEPGFSWGTGTAKTKSSRTGGGPIVNGSSQGQGYTGYVMSNGFLIGECDSAGCTVPGGGFNTDQNHLIPYDFRAVNDGQWREFVVRIKPNSAVGVADGQFEAFVNGVSVGSANNYILHTDPSHTIAEAWAGWMVMPYFQLNGTALDGGTIYVGDFSTDNVFNSRFTVRPKNIAYYVCSMLPPEAVPGKRTYRAHLMDWLKTNAAPGTWQRAQLVIGANPDGTPARNFCLVLLDADESVHAAYAAVAGVNQVTTRNMSQVITASERNRIRTFLTNRGLDGSVVVTGMTYAQVAQAVGIQLDPAFNDIIARGA